MDELQGDWFQQGDRLGEGEAPEDFADLDDAPVRRGGHLAYALAGAGVLAGLFLVLHLI